MKDFFKNTGNWLILGFISAALGMIFLAYKATTVKFDLVVQGDYYQLEVELNDLIAAKSNAYQLGKDFSFQDNGEQLILHIPDSISQNLELGFIEFYCVSNSDLDTKQSLPKKSEGTYLFNRNEVAKGKNYLIKVGFRANEKEFYREFKMN